MNAQCSQACRLSTITAMPCPPPMSRRLAGVSEAGARSRDPDPARDSLQRLYDHGYSLSTSDTGRCQTMFLFPSPQLVKQSDHQARSGGSQWMPQRYCTTVDINLVAIKSQFLFDGEI